MTRLIDDEIFATPAVRAGRFRCAPGHAAFTDSGPTAGHIVVFPRTGVWIRHARSRPFVADPNVVTIYNRGQEYSREALSPDGDRCDWFGVAPPLACEIAERLLPAHAVTPERPFAAEFAPCSPALYVRQRRIHGALTRGTLTGLAAEEAIVALVADALHAAPSAPGAMRAREVRPVHRDLAMRARMVLARDPAHAPDLATLAGALGVSPFHLCRVFRAITGTTLHGYLVDLRLRAALERLAGAPRAISRVALESGFSSHSHFVHWCRRRFGTVPSRLTDLAPAA